MAINIMTTEEFAKQMTELAEKYDDDVEMCHYRMDCLMCEVLTSLGYSEGIAVFDEAHKWYA